MPDDLKYISVDDCHNRETIAKAKRWFLEDAKYKATAPISVALASSLLSLAEIGAEAVRLFDAMRPRPGESDE